VPPSPPPSPSATALLLRRLRLLLLLLPPLRLPPSGFIRCDGVSRPKHLHTLEETASEKKRMRQISLTPSWASTRVPAQVVDVAEGTTCTYMQLNKGTELTKVELWSSPRHTYRHGYDIHRRMWADNVSSHDQYSLAAKMADVRDGISTTSRRQLSTKYRLEIFAHTGVPAQEYDISLPCGMRREALPVRNELKQLATGQNDNTGRSTKPTAQGRGSSTTERRMEDYFTRTHHGRKRKVKMSHNATGQISSTGGCQLRWRYPEANHLVVRGRECRAAQGGRGRGAQGGVKQPTAGVGLRLL
jgi:hypothetical protein